MKKLLGAVALSLSVFVSFSAHAQDDTQGEKEELENKIDVLAGEVERLKQGEDILPPVGQGKFGLAPAASKVYSVKKGVSIGGYGEMLYEHFASETESGVASNARDQLDFLRAIIYLGYRFDDNFIFNSEIEFEHGSTGNSGSVSVEFAYLDYLFRDYLNFRAGMVLVPMGFINELHEPTTFLSTERPETEKALIPSTWRENGMGVFGQTENISYRAYVVNGFDGIGGGTSNASGFSAAGLRGGRQKGSKALASDVAFTGRVDYIGKKGLLIGTSAYVGNSGQDVRDASGKVKALTTIVEGHVDFDLRGAQFRGLLAYAHQQDAARINALQGNTTTGVAEDMLGYYAELGYNLFEETHIKQSLVPFFRFEALDTQLDTPTGFTEDLARKQQIYTAGVSYKPISNVVLKGDYQIRKNDAETGINQLNFALGYMF